ncbi:hypothetical protein F4780DRAFT_779637 [Xylariomycetidae sp. FL0641]|nr:hypothetical protein F4780DRAFT_779637 [Xylariomycetidae sp. FL0641]
MHRARARIQFSVLLDLELTSKSRGPMHNHAMTRWGSRTRPSVQALFFLRTAGRHERSLHRYCWALRAPDASPGAAAAPRRTFAHVPHRRATGSGSSEGGRGDGEPGWWTRRRRRRRQLTLASLSGILAIWLCARALADADADAEAGLNPRAFRAFEVVAREPVSATAFVLSLRGGQEDGRKEMEKGRIRDAWDHGLWSVEVKQPQLQIARHYTPLPPAAAATTTTTGKGDEGSTVAASGDADADADADDTSTIRLLVRRVPGGEMSAYLAKQRVGDVVWLRGPHLGFDVARRLGLDRNNNNNAASSPSSSAEDDDDAAAAGDVVFVAGGTGIAPALQVVRRLLEEVDGEEGKTTTTERGRETTTTTTTTPSNSNSSSKTHPTVSILWANRHAADALGRDSSSSAPSSSLATQLRALRARHGARLRVAYFVDEEGSYIDARTLANALSTTSTTSNPPPPPPTAATTCPWHDPALLAQQADAEDALRADACACRQEKKQTKTKKNLVFVSGPDGFVAALAGPKRWAAGRELQGAVGGALGRLLGPGAGWGEQWLVLKL